MGRRSREVFERKNREWAWENAYQKKAATPDTTRRLLGTKRITFTGYSRIVGGNAVMSINPVEDVCWHSVYNDDCFSCWDRERRRIKASLQQIMHDLNRTCNCTLCIQVRQIQRKHAR